LQRIPLSEILTSPNDGIIIDESTPVEIAKAIKLILNKTDDFQPNTEHVIEKFSLDAMNNQLLKIFKLTK
jgi:glycosyltransferase involved in cell wall biosynthesis